MVDRVRVVRAYDVCPSCGYRRHSISSVTVAACKSCGLVEGVWRDVVETFEGPEPEPSELVVGRVPLVRVQQKRLRLKRPPKVLVGSSLAESVAVLTVPEPLIKPEPLIQVVAPPKRPLLARVRRRVRWGR